MDRKVTDSGQARARPIEVPSGPRTVRFRTRVVSGSDALNRQWQGVYSFGSGWSTFDIMVDLNRLTLTLRRSPDTDYEPLLRKLAGRSEDSTTPLPPPTGTVESRTFDIELVGLKMPKVNAGSVPAGSVGDWLVIQAFLPRSAESFLLGFNDSQQAGELVIPRPEAVPAVVHAMTQIFG